MNHLLRALAASVLAVGALDVAGQSSDSPGGDVLVIDHYVPVVSRLPSIAGETVQLYVRERTLGETVLRSGSLAGRVILFVHGAGTPAEVAFDPPYPDASWMAHLARGGYDVFSMEMTGYGRSTRPLVMNNPCNLAEAQQNDFIPDLIPDACPPAYGFATGTIASDWHDLDAVVGYIRELRGVERVHLAGWSLGGPRAGGYAARHPDRVETVVLLSPAYSRSRAASPPDGPVPGAAFTKQSRADFDALWDRQLGCPNQYEPAVRNAVWSAMLESDPVGATWGTGVRRAPRVTTWGFGPAEVGEMRVPMLLIAPETDGQVSPARVAELYEDLGSERKILLHLACSSHNAMWETNRSVLFEASLQWFRDGSVDGVESGELRLGHGP